MSRLQNNDGAKTVFLEITGMTCNACVNTIESYLANTVDGVLKVAVSLINERGEVLYDPLKTTEKDIQQAVDDIGFGASIVAPAAEDEVQLSIQGMTCGACVQTIESVISTVPGIVNISVNLATETGKVKFSPLMIGPRDVITQINDLGFQTSLYQPEINHKEKTEEIEKQKAILFYCLVVMVMGIAVMLMHMFIMEMHMVLETRVLFGVSLVNLIFWLFATPIQFYVGRKFYINAWKAIKFGHPDMNVLIVLGTSCAYIFSLFSVFYGAVYPKFPVKTFFEMSTMLIPIILFGKHLETIAKGKTSQAIQKLMGLRANEAILIQNYNNNSSSNNSGGNRKEQSISVDLIQRGDHLKLLPGTSIPSDGIVVFGSTCVDESMLTGESMPIPKEIGDYVIGGTTNLNGMIIVRATQVGRNSSLSKIIRLVEEAQSSKAPIQQLADKISSYFVPIVVVLGVLTLIVWMLLTKFGVVPVPPGSNEYMFSLMFSISVIVISCPCALGLATPTGIMVGTGIGAQMGVLIKGGADLEIAHRIQVVVFDKTGTLTAGRPTVTRTHVIYPEKLSEEKLYYYAGSAESSSEHPLATAVLNKARELKVEVQNQLSAFKNEPGAGITCTVDGKSVLVGNMELMNRHNININDNVSSLLSSITTTHLIIVVDKIIIGVIEVDDPIKPEAETAISYLRHNLGIDCWMVTGDNTASANRVAKAVGISNILAEVKPAGKVAQVKNLQSTGKIVGFVGDGINDSPALAQADVGIAIGAGTDIAIEAANIVLIKNSLLDVITAIDLSTKTFQRIKLNFMWAMLYNIISIPLAAGLLYPVARIQVPPLIAGTCMAFSSLSVLLSSLLLKRYQKPQIAHDILSDVAVMNAEDVKKESKKPLLQSTDF